MASDDTSFAEIVLGLAFWAAVLYYGGPWLKEQFRPQDQPASIVGPVSTRSAPGPRSIIPEQLAVLAPQALTLTTTGGDKVKLPVGEKTIIVGIATWCPHSANFVKAAASPEGRKLLTDYDLAFVLESDEWPGFRKELEHMSREERGGRTVDEAVAFLKEEAGGGGLYSPEMLDTLPARHYFLSREDAERLGLNSFPTAYVSSTGKFSQHPVELIRKVTGSDRIVDLVIAQREHSK